jgi:hypothetical protein
MKGPELKAAIQAAEGRTLLAELIVDWASPFGDVSLPEVARAFGADLLLLNLFDMNRPRISGLPVEEGEDVVRTAKRLTGRPIGVNLEPVDPNATVMEERTAIPDGRTLTKHSIKRLRELGFDFVCITGNPKTGVTNGAIMKGIGLIREILGNELLIIAGKMHAAGTWERWSEQTFVELGIQFVDAGADVVLFPAPGTVPGADVSVLREAVNRVHARGGLVMAAVGTSQEGADVDTVRCIALDSKKMGADIFHLGDAGLLGMAPPENLLAASIALRGRRHAYRRMATSVRR